MDKRPFPETQSYRNVPAFFTNLSSPFVITMISVFAAEIAVMFIISQLPPMSVAAEAVVDALLLTFIVTPAFYLFCVNNQRQDGKERKAAGITILKDLKDMAVDAAEHSRIGELFFSVNKEWEYTFDTITDIITVHDRNFNIIRANRAAVEMLKLPSLKSNRQVKCYRYYHAKNSPPEKCPSCECLKTEQPVSFEIFEPNLDSYLEIRAMPLYDRNNNYSGIIHVARNVTENRRAKEKIRLRINRLNVLHSIEKTFNSTLDLCTTLDHCVDQITTQIGIDAATVLLFRRHTQSLDYVVSKGLRSGALKYTNLKLGESNAGSAAMERRIIHIKNLKDTPGNFRRSGLFAEEEFISYFAVPLFAKGELKGVLELFHRSAVDADREWLEFLDTIADQAAIAIDNSALFESLQKSNIELSLAYDNTIEGWSSVLDMRDKATEGHSRRVTDMTLRIAQEMGVKEQDLVHIRRGAFLHDIGKIGVPDDILLKPGELSDEERTIMKRHTRYAFDILQKIDYLRPAADIPYYHHERWDGRGYPRGLKGKEIPLGARIFAVADVWDALCSDRPYRPAWPKERVLDHIRSLSGSHFDPEIVEVFLLVEGRGA
ncbi:MAG: HD domain-containing protein [Nitrospirae bacterium]|nr:HD domain-containing protein [Nitrospirota bacterium]